MSEQENMESFSLIPENKPDFYDENGNFSPEKVQNLLDTEKQETEKYKKQALDMRRKLSKGVVVPSSIEEYDDWTPDEKYAKFYNDSETEAGVFAKECLAEINKMAFENAFSKEQSSAVKNMFNQLMENLNIFETATPEEQNQKKLEWLRQEKEKLGEQADSIIEQSGNFYKNCNLFAPEEKQLILSLMNQGAEGVRLFHKIKGLLAGNHLGDDIPFSSGLNGLPDDYTLAREYNSITTTPERRFQILKLRQEAGRNGGLPLL